jgi:hypothetical protein
LGKHSSGYKKIAQLLKNLLVEKYNYAPFSKVEKSFFSLPPETYFSLLFLQLKPKVQIGIAIHKPVLVFLAKSGLFLINKSKTS